MPPLLPGAALAYTVEQTFTAAGSIDDFNATAFGWNLAATVGVPPSHVSVNATSASVRVVATITAADSSVSNTIYAALATLAANGTTAASASLGVTLETITPPVAFVETIFASPSTPPPAMPPPSDPPPQLPAEPPPLQPPGVDDAADQNADQACLIAQLGPSCPWLWPAIIAAGASLVLLCVFLPLTMWYLRRRRRRRAAGDNLVPALSSPLTSTKMDQVAIEMPEAPSSGYIGAPVPPPLDDEEEAAMIAHMSALGPYAERNEALSMSVGDCLTPIAEAPSPSASQGYGSAIPEAQYLAPAACACEYACEGGTGEGAAAGALPWMPTIVEPQASSASERRRSRREGSRRERREGSPGEEEGEQVPRVASRRRTRHQVEDSAVATSGGAVASGSAVAAGGSHRSVEEIRAEHKEVKARLRDYEIDFEEQYGRKPRKRRDWGPVIEEYELYATLREEEKAALAARV